MEGLVSLNSIVITTNVPDKNDPYRRNVQYFTNMNDAVKFYVNMGLYNYYDLNEMRKLIDSKLGVR